MPRNPTNKVTPEKKEIAFRLRRIWNAKAKTLGLTQTGVAERLGISQAALSQYINGHVATNTDIILKLANILDIEPKEVDPRILITSAPRLTLVPRTVLSRGGMMGQLQPTTDFDTVLVDQQYPTDKLSTVVMDTDHYAPRYFTSEKLVLLDAKVSELKDGDEVLIQWEDGVNELMRVGETIGDMLCLMDILKPEKELNKIQRFRFDGGVFKVIGRA